MTDDPFCAFAGEHDSPPTHKVKLHIPASDVRIDGLPMRVSLGVDVLAMLCDRHYALLIAGRAG